LRAKIFGHNSGVIHVPEARFIWRCPTKLGLGDLSALWPRTRPRCRNYGSGEALGSVRELPPVQVPRSDPCREPERGLRVELRPSPILGSSCASSCVQALRGGGGRGGAQANHHAPAQDDGVRAHVWRAADSLNRPRAAGGLTYRRQSSAVGVSRPQRADSSLRRIAGGAPRVDPRIRHRPA
jgi:hypothetical protein